jgi:hypothetical protein
MDEDDDAEREPLFLDDSTPSKLRTDAMCAAPCNLFLKDRELLQDEISGMANLTIPVIITSFLEMLPGIVTIILVGRAEYDDDGGDDVDGEINTTSMKQLHLDAAALAVMIMNVVALSPAFGKCKCCIMICMPESHRSKSSFSVHHSPQSIKRFRKIKVCSLRWIHSALKHSGPANLPKWVPTRSQG